MSKDSNILIAAFDGYTVKGDLVYIPNDPYKGNFSIDILDYHKNWNTLMPVIEKIESMGYSVSIERYLVQIIKSVSPDIMGLINVLAQSDDDKKIDLANTAVTQFIQWYNQQSLT